MISKIKRLFTLKLDNNRLLSITPSKIEIVRGQFTEQEIKEMREKVSHLSYLYSNFPIPRFGKITQEQIDEVRDFINSFN